MTFKIVVSDSEFGDLIPETEVIEAAGFKLTPHQCKTEDELIAACADADGILNQYAQFTPRVIASLEKCRIISRYGIGLNTIDVPAATERGICVGNVPDGSLEEVSDHAVAMMLSLARGLPKFTDDMKEGIWNYKRVRPLYRTRGRTLGLISFGNIAQRVATKMAGFGVKVLAFDPYGNAELAREMGVELVDLDTLCAASDFISVHVPLLPSTHHLLTTRHFDMMKPEAIVVNTARGPVIDEQALLAALEGRKIAGAGLDVFETEPMGPGHAFTKFDNVVLSSHAAWYSEDSEREIRSKTAQNVVDVLLGRFPTYLANPDVRSKISDLT